MRVAPAIEVSSEARLELEKLTRRRVWQRFWPSRLLQLGVAGLMKDALRPGRTPAIQPNRVAGVIARTAQTIPAEKEIYLICGNYATHKHPCVQRWLLKHKRFHFCFTQT